MTGFDIQSLHNFTPPRFHCERCLAIYAGTTAFVVRGDSTRRLICPSCKVEYLPTDTYGFWQLGEYLDQVGKTIRADDPISHARTLASIAMKMRSGASIAYPPMRALFEAFSCAKSFVHFVSYGISLALIGALKVTAQRIAVRGVVSNPDRLATEELGFTDEARDLEIQLMDSSAGNMPHQKIIIVDGLLAFKGSANLTVQGWRKAAEGLDIVEAVTRLDEIVDLHNRFFSPLWVHSSKVKSPITMTDVPF